MAASCGNATRIWSRDSFPTELWEQVLKIKCPTIYILGGASSIVPPETQQKLRESLPVVQIVTMPKLGHYPHQEAPQDYIRIVQTFLSGKRDGLLAR